MKRMTKVGSSDLLIRRELFEGQWSGIGDAPFRYSLETGFHIYGKLNLQLQLSAAEDTSRAQQYLKVIHAYASIAEECGKAAGAILLEVQGEVVHLILPGAHDAETTIRTLAFCKVFNDIVYSRLAPMAGDNWEGFKMATDHGATVLIENGNNSSDSIVSLSPAANAPAKQLPSTDAAHLAIRTGTLEKVTEVSDRRKEWTQYDLRAGISVSVQRLSNNQAFLATEATMRSSAEAVMQKQASYSPTVNMRLDEEVVKIAGIDGPARIQGFYIRADMDGFTDDVQAAFDKGEAAILALVERFSAIMGFADAFTKTHPRTFIRLPWAGDCANMIVMSSDATSYKRDRASVPAVIPAEWHSMTGVKYSEDQRWKDLLGESDWAVAAIGGNDEEGNNGLLLVADITAGERRFRIAAGWGARRSLDALDTSGVRKRDTILHRVDYGALSSNYQVHFSKLNSLFYRANSLTKEKLAKAAIEEESKTSPLVIPSVGVKLPKQEPHYES